MAQVIILTQINGGGPLVISTAKIVAQADGSGSQVIVDGNTFKVTETPADIEAAANL